jgi:hypothetical protein
MRLSLVGLILVSSSLMACGSSDPAPSAEPAALTEPAPTAAATARPDVREAPIAQQEIPTPVASPVVIEAPPIAPTVAGPEAAPSAPAPTGAVAP